MSTAAALDYLASEMRAWRHDIHRYPELMYEEHRTSDLIADCLLSFGLDVVRGVGKTGVVGSLHRGGSNSSIALRADMDALPIHEETCVPYRSRHDGKMHACGHDGHVAMLLGAAKHLAKNPKFNGTVHFVFQPAEEGGAGAQAMIDDGLFQDRSIDSVFGMHNWPGMSTGAFGTCPGPMMASYDTFEITIQGVGAHGAMPERSRDPIPVGALLISALQTIVSRNLAPSDAGVVSVTQLSAGDADNVIPGTLTMRGSARAFSVRDQDTIETRMRETVEGVCSAHGTCGVLQYDRIYPCLINTPSETEIACDAARSLVGADGVDSAMTPTVASEDFSFMLNAKPGCHIFVGNGLAEGGCLLHNARYDFNDDILTLGAAYWCALVERKLND
ncbi:MAG: M20 aminoacylase family protein [Pseudomonadales bacterium]